MPLVATAEVTEALPAITPSFYDGTVLPLAQQGGRIKINNVWFSWSNMISNGSTVNINMSPTSCDNHFIVDDCTTSCFGTNSIWVDWNGAIGQTIQNGYIRLVWNNWSTNAAPNGFHRVQIIETEEQKKFRQQQQEQYDREQQERARKIEEARGRAALLLDSQLNPEQKKDYKEKGFFFLYTQSGKKYRIEKGRAGNVRLVDETNKILKRYCIHPYEAVPDDDTVLAQKLLLETNEEEFLKLANAS